jgi:hypothetical protein
MRFDRQLVAIGLAGLVATCSAGAPPALSDGYAARPAPRYHKKRVVVQRVARPDAWCRFQARNLYVFDRRTRGGLLASWDEQRIAASLRSDVLGTCGAGYWRPTHRWSYR